MSLKRTIAILTTLFPLACYSQDQPKLLTPNKVFSLSAGFSSIYDSEIDKKFSGTVDMNILGFYFGFAGYDYSGEGDALNFESDRSFFSHIGKLRLSLGYSYLLNYNEFRSPITLTPYVNIIGRAEIWQDPIGNKTFFRKNKSTELGLGLKTSINFDRFFTSFNISTDDVGISIGYVIFEP